MPFGMTSFTDDYFVDLGDAYPPTRFLETVYKA